MKTNITKPQPWANVMKTFVLAGHTDSPAAHTGSPVYPVNYFTFPERSWKHIPLLPER